MIGVTRLMRTETSKASFSRSKRGLESTGFGSPSCWRIVERVCEQVVREGKLPEGYTIPR